MRVFDALIFNDDRHPGNVLVDSSWTLWLIDHTRGFQVEPTIRDPDRLNRIGRRLWTRLALLERQQLEAILLPLLERDQVDALITRRDAIIDHFANLIALSGEEAIVYGHQ